MRPAPQPDQAQPLQPEREGPRRGASTLASIIPPDEARPSKAALRLTSAPGDNLPWHASRAGDGWHAAAAGHCQHFASCRLALI